MKKLYIIPIVILGVFCTIAFAQEGTPQFGKLSYQYLTSFDSKGARPAGQEEEKIAADYIVSQLTSFGYSADRQKFSQTIEWEKQIINISSENIICVKKGVSTKEIIVSAHYDSVTAGNGTDDNASGICLLLEICKKIREETTPFTIRFIFFGSEEYEGVGSNYYAQQMGNAERSNTIVIVNCDSLLAGDNIYVHGSLGDKGIVRDWMLNRAAALGIPLIIQNGKNEKYPAGSTGGWGDQVAFNNVGIQYVVFEAAN